MSEAKKQVLLLSEVGGLSYKEIAECMSNGMKTDRHKVVRDCAPPPGGPARMRAKLAVTRGETRLCVSEIATREPKVRVFRID